jgi:hypothetical protein
MAYFADYEHKIYVQMDLNYKTDAIRANSTSQAVKPTSYTSKFLVSIVNICVVEKPNVPLDPL